jgi:hypothetical protein
MHQLGTPILILWYRFDAQRPCVLLLRLAVIQCSTEGAGVQAVLRNVKKRRDRRKTLARHAAQGRFGEAAFMLHNRRKIACCRSLASRW